MILIIFNQNHLIQKPSYTYHFLIPTPSSSFLCISLRCIICKGYPSYGYFPAAAAGAGGPANGIAGGGGGGAGGGGGGGGNTPGGERSGSQPSAATYYDYTNGGGPAAFHRGPGLDQHNPAGNMGNSPLLRDAYTGRSGQHEKKTYIGTKINS